MKERHCSRRQATNSRSHRGYILLADFSSVPGFATFVASKARSGEPPEQEDWSPWTHFYYDQHLALCSFRVHRSRKALVASDHLPLLVELEVNVQS